MVVSHQVCQPPLAVLLVQFGRHSFSDDRALLITQYTNECIGLCYWIGLVAGFICIHLHCMRPQALTAVCRHVLRPRKCHAAYGLHCDCQESLSWLQLLLLRLKC